MLINQKKFVILYYGHLFVKYFDADRFDIAR